MKKPHLRIFAFLRGGMGNQLYIYAMASLIAKETGGELSFSTALLPEHFDKLGKVSRWPEQISSFDKVVPIIKNHYQPRNRTSLISKLLTLLEKSASVFHKLTLGRAAVLTDSNFRQLYPRLSDKKLKFILMLGIFGDHSFFEKSRSELRSKIMGDYFETTKELVSRSCAAIHLRLGDMEKLGITSLEVYDEYVDRVLKALSSDSRIKCLYVFSDDPASARQLFKLKSTKLVVSFEMPDSTPIETLRKLSRFPLIFGSNSSFSWWASFLQENETGVSIFQEDWKYWNEKPRIGNQLKMSEFEKKLGLT